MPDTRPRLDEKAKPANAGDARPAHHVTATIADLLAERADQLHMLASQFRSCELSDSLPPHRILAMSGDLLAMADDLEAAGHRLATRLRPSVLVQ